MVWPREMYDPAGKDLAGRCQQVFERTSPGNRGDDAHAYLQRFGYLTDKVYQGGDARNPWKENLVYREEQVFKKNRDLLAAGRGAQTAFLIHIVAYVAETGQDPPSMHISHLCDNRRCFNPYHLVAETPQLNNPRKGCASRLYTQI